MGPLTSVRNPSPSASSSTNMSSAFLSISLIASLYSVGSNSLCWGSSHIITKINFISSLVIDPTKDDMNGFSLNNLHSPDPSLSYNINCHFSLSFTLPVLCNFNYRDAVESKNENVCLRWDGSQSWIPWKLSPHHHLWKSFWLKALPYRVFQKYNPFITQRGEMFLGHHLCI